MPRRRYLIPLLLVLTATRCSDGIDSPTAAPVRGEAAGETPHMLQWGGTTDPAFRATGPFRGPVASGVQLAAGEGLNLDRYTLTFWAVRGDPRSVQVNSLGFDGNAGGPFLQFDDVDPAYAPGRGALEPGDSVQITITIDPDNIALTFEPSGLLFQQPASLRISYRGADGDLNGDGDVDEGDAQIEQRLLGIWYREGDGAAWTPISAFHSLAEKSFTIALEHFSEWALAW